MKGLQSLVFSQVGVASSLPDSPGALVAVEVLSRATVSGSIHSVSGMQLNQLWFKQGSVDVCGGMQTQTLRRAYRSAFALHAASAVEFWSRKLRKSKNDVQKSAFCLSFNRHCLSFEAADPNCRELTTPSHFSRPSEHLKHYS